MLMLGREVRRPCEISFSTPNDSEFSNYGDYVLNLKEKINKANQIVQKHLKSSTKRQKDFYDAKSHPQNFKVGDLVWYLAEKRQEGVNPKLLSPFIGPCLIIKKYNNIDYRIQLDNSGRQRVVHHNKLQPYLSDSIPKWTKKVRSKLCTK